MNNRYEEYIETARNIPMQNNIRENWNIRATAGQQEQVEQDVSHLEAIQRQRNPLAGLVVGEIQEGEIPGKRPQQKQLPSKAVKHQQKSADSSCLLI